MDMNILQRHLETVLQSHQPEGGGVWFSAAEFEKCVEAICRGEQKKASGAPSTFATQIPQRGLNRKGLTMEKKSVVSRLVLVELFVESSLPRFPWAKGGGGFCVAYLSQTVLLSNHSKTFSWQLTVSAGCALYQEVSRA